MKTWTPLSIVHYQLSFAPIQSPTPTNFQLHDLHSSFKSQPNCSNKPAPSPKPTQKFISIELQTSNTINLQINKTHPNIETNNRHRTFNAFKSSRWTTILYFGVFYHHELGLLLSLHPHPHIHRKCLTLALHQKYLTSFHRISLKECMRME